MSLKEAGISNQEKSVRGITGGGIEVWVDHCRVGDQHE
jgi:hypothetical protein